MPWQGDEWVEPEWSLGWQIADWAERYFTVPGGAFAGEPLVLKNWQLYTLVDWYAVNRLGRFLYRRGVVRMAKKSGKSPLGAVIVAAEFCGPAKFDGWDAAGEPVGAPVKAPWVQVAAVSEDQTANTYSPFAAMMRESDLVTELRIDVGVYETKFAAKRDARVEVVTSAAKSREGQPITAAVADELQGWNGHNGGHRLDRVLRRNAAPLGGRVLGLCNAWEPGVGSVAQRLEESARVDPVMVIGPQYERPGVDLTDVDAMRDALAWVYRDCPWVDVESVLADATAADQDPVECHRFYFNWCTGGTDSLGVGMVTTAEPLRAGDPVALGFDGSIRHDCTALVAQHMVTGALYLLGLWARPLGLSRRAPWRVPTEDVMTTVERAFAVYDVVRMKADPSLWRDELATWQQTWGRDVVDRMPVDLHSVVHGAVEATRDGLRSGSFAVDGGPGSEVLRAHLTRAVVTRRVVGAKILLGLGKPEEGDGDNRIDAAAASCYAVLARLEALAKGWEMSEALDPLQAVY